MVYIYTVSNSYVYWEVTQFVSGVDNDDYKDSGVEYVDFGVDKTGVN